MTTIALDVQGLVKTYGGRREAQTQALRNVSFQVPQGDFVAIMGPSGSGKSTLLNCIATIDRPTGGEILLNNTALSQLNAKQLAQFRRDQLGFIFQDANLLDTLTCFENIALPLSLRKANPASIKERIRLLASQLGILEVLDKYPYQISGGQCQRVAAARAVIAKPALILADEPTGALDSKSAQDLLETLRLLNSQGATILMVTHDALSASYAKRAIFIKDGSLYKQITDDESGVFYDKIVANLVMLGSKEA